MSTIKTQNLPSIGNLASGDYLVGERVPGTTGLFTVSGTGSGSIVYSISPTITSATLVTPSLGTPASGTLTNCTGYPIASITNLYPGMATFLTTPSSANLASTVLDYTGTPGSIVFNTSPTFVTPHLGVPISGTLTNCTNYPVSNLAGLGTNVASFLNTPSSANLAAALTDETGSGAAVFATSPTLVTPLLGTPTSGSLANCTGYPVANVANLGTGVATFLTTPSSANLAAALTDETGSGAAVFATSPTLVTPTLGAALATSLQLSNTGIKDNSGNNMLALTATGSANYLTLANAASSGTPAYTATGSDSNISVQLDSKGTGGIILKGTSTNDSAAAGYVGENISSTVSAVAITSNTQTNITSISLTAGDWDVYGQIVTTPAGTTTQSRMYGSISTTTATVTTPEINVNIAITAGNTWALPVPPIRISASGTTTVYLVGLIVYAVSTLTVGGNILARRVR